MRLTGNKTHSKTLTGLLLRMPIQPLRSSAEAWLECTFMSLIVTLGSHLILFMAGARWRRANHKLGQELRSGTG
jgi:hypothetical protein